MALRARHEDDTSEDRLNRLCDRVLGTGRVRTTALCLSWLSGAVLLVLFITMVIPNLEQQRGERTRESIPQVQIVNAPQWLMMTPDLLEQIQSMIATNAGGRADDITGLRNAHAVAVESGWFEAVDRVERLPDGTIEIHGEMTTPFAVVRWQDEDHLVSLIICSECKLRSLQLLQTPVGQRKDHLGIHLE